MLITLQTQTGKGEKRLDPSNRGQTSNNHNDNKKKSEKIVDIRIKDAYRASDTIQSS